jgi:nitrate/nitrite transport system permease protein
VQNKRAFYQRQGDRDAARLAQNPNYDVKIRSDTGKPRFIDYSIIQALFL